MSTYEHIIWGTGEAGQVSNNVADFPQCICW